MSTSTTYTTEVQVCSLYVRLEQTYVDFGQCTDLNESYTRPLTVRNFTKGCLIVQWIRGASGSVFHVEPESQMIPP